MKKRWEKKRVTQNIDKGISIYHELKSDTIQYSTSERRINVLGYRLLGQDKIDAALEVFKLNREEYPKSANTYDSYGNALLKKGDSTNALKNFERCFEIDSTLNYLSKKAVKLEAILNLKK